jgi:hypothetical protein
MLSRLSQGQRIFVTITHGITLLGVVVDVGACNPPPDVVLVNELEPEADEAEEVADDILVVCVVDDEAGLDVVVVDVGRVVLVEDVVLVTKSISKFKP